jgi:hypothetical protein
VRASVRVHYADSDAVGAREEDADSDADGAREEDADNYPLDGAGLQGMPRVTPGAREEDAAIVNERNNMHMKRLHALIPLGAVDAQVAKLLARTFPPPLYTYESTSSFLFTSDVMNYPLDGAKMSKKRLYARDVAAPSYRVFSATLGRFFSLLRDCSYV